MISYIFSLRPWDICLILMFTVFSAGITAGLIIVSREELRIAVCRQICHGWIIRAGRRRGCEQKQMVRAASAAGADEEQGRLSAPAGTLEAAAERPPDADGAEIAERAGEQK